MDTGRTCTDRNLSSGWKQDPRSYEVATLPAAPPTFCQIFIAIICEREDFLLKNV